MMQIRSTADDNRPETGGSSLVLALATAAGIGIALAYGWMGDVGFHYDDFHLVRPWSAIEWRRAWLGSWDPTGIEPVFYRPLTAAWYAVRFHWFALNATAMHALSLVGHAACAMLLGWLLRREGATVRLAAFGAWTYAVHPAMPYAQVSWLTNQMHLAQSLVVVGALLVWQVARDRHAGWWTPIAALAVMAFLIKEDGIMLLPVIAALTALRVWVLGARAPRAWVLLAVAALCLLVGLVALRDARLGRLGGYGTPEFRAIVPNYVKGIQSAFFLWPTTRTWQAVASVITCAALLVALGLTRRRPGRLPLKLAGAALVVALSLNVPAAFRSSVSYSVVAWQGLASGAALTLLVLGLGVALWHGLRVQLFLLAAGLAVALGFDLPFVFVSKREQYHLVGLGSALAIAGAASAIGSLAARPRRRAVAWVALVAATLPFPFLARHLARDFLSCSGPVLRADQIAKGWWVVPLEVKEWIDLKAQRCAAGLGPSRVTDLPVVAWDVYPEPVPGEPGSARWTSERPVALFARDAVSATLELRRPDAAPDRLVRVTTSSSGGTQVLMLDSAAWRRVTVRFSPGPLAWLRHAQRVDLLVEPWFVPGARDPTSRDLRRHGVQWRILAIGEAAGR